MAKLEYKIERTEEEREIYLEAKPSEWATTARASIILKDWGSGPVPRIGNIGWSAGAREWTVEDARTFFRAALELLDKAEEELTRARGGR